MSKQVEETPTYALPYEGGPKKPHFDKEYIESKINAFSEAHKGETAEQIEAECRGEEVPIEIGGKKVRVAYCKPEEDCCARCCLGSGETCIGLDGGEEWPCKKFGTETAYFVPAEDTSDTHLLDMLLEAINYTYKQLNGKYGNLSYVVSDKVKYIERVRAKKIEQKMREEYEARECGEAKPEADLEAEFKKWWENTDGKINIEHTMYWYMEDCARHFYNLNPEHNGFKWHKFSEQLPPLGVPVLAFHHNWINADFNPEGIRIGHLQENCSSYDGKYDFCSAHWWDYQDCFVTISKSDVEGKEQGFSEDIVNSIMPEYWIELPMFNPKHK